MDDVGEFLSDEADPALEQALLSGQTIGRPLMEDAQLRALEKDFATTHQTGSAGTAWQGDGRQGQIKNTVNSKVST